MRGRITTCSNLCWRAGTQTGITGPVDGFQGCDEEDYTDELFAADLRKPHVRKKLDEMLRQALEEDARGETEEWPRR